MKPADSTVPAATAQMVSRCTRRESLSQPKIHRPRNVDSRKKAIRPSIASGAPKMSPTSREYADQFIPNSNSWTRPVTTPTATLITSSAPKNLVSRRYSGADFRCQAVCSSAVRKASPIVTGTKKKWLIDVSANCQRARSSVISCPPTAIPLPPVPFLVAAWCAPPALGDVSLLRGGQGSPHDRPLRRHHHRQRRWRRDAGAHARAIGQEDPAAGARRLSAPRDGPLGSRSGVRRRHV